MSTKNPKLTETAYICVPDLGAIRQLSLSFVSAPSSLSESFSEDVALILSWIEPVERVYAYHYEPTYIKIRVSYLKGK